MNATIIKKVNLKMKNLPDSVFEEVDKFIDYLNYRQTQNEFQIPEWQQEIVLKRIKENKIPTDAFEMIDDLEIKK